MKYLLTLLISLWVSQAQAQQSERFDQFELHYSIVYTTFLTAEIAAEFGIPRGKDKAMLTLSVRDADAGDIEGRPMAIEGRTWDLITGGDMKVKEVKEGPSNLLSSAFRVPRQRISFLRIHLYT